MANAPITRSVLSWAIAESGLSVEEVSARIGADVSAWIDGFAQPTVTQLREVAQALSRPMAMFFLPRPPDAEQPSVKFRHALREERASLNYEERKAVREAFRQQRMMKWVIRELALPTQPLPAIDIKTKSDDAASRLRQWLGIAAGTQTAWPTASRAFAAWREQLESRGVFVFTFSMGEESCRGFSIFDELAPVVAINTTWKIEARVFSLFHELGHLVTRTDSACAATPSMSGSQGDPAERWCEQFASALLIPMDALREALVSDGFGAGTKADLGEAARIATRFRVSLRAAVLRLVEAGAAGWDLYKAIPAAIDKKSDQRGGKGRTRADLRVAAFGRRATQLYLKALDAEIIGRHDLMDYLNVPDSELEKLQRAE